VIAKEVKLKVAAMMTVAASKVLSLILSKYLTARMTPMMEPSWAMVEMKPSVFSLTPKLSLTKKNMLLPVPGLMRQSKMKRIATKIMALVSLSFLSLLKYLNIQTPKLSQMAIVR